MSIQSELFTLLSTGGTDCAARVYPVVAPDTPVVPYMVYSRINTNSENVLSGSSGLANTRMQIDVYAKTYTQAQAIARQVDALMAGWSNQNISVMAQDLFEEPVKLHRVIMDFSIWHAW